MLVFAGIIVLMSAPGQSFSVATFIDPMLAELRVGRTQFSTAYLVATLLCGFLMPWVGRLLDKVGARRMLPVIALLLGGACFLMGSVHGIITLYVGFTLIRCLGQGSLTLIGTWIISEWFERRRGLAMGLMGLGSTLSVMVIPQLNDVLIDLIGWRNAWRALAVLVWVILVLPGILLLRDRPEDLGLLPDGRRPDSNDANRPTASSNQSEEVPQRAWTAQEARWNATFWKLLSVIFTTAMIGTGLVFHQVSILKDCGISRTDALRLLGLQAAVGTGMTLLAGYLTDRFQARYLLVFSMLFLAGALGLLLVMPSPGWAILYASLLGLQGGIIRTTGMAVWVEYYGRLHQGAVRGIVMSVMVIGAAFGPLPFALAKDYLGNYDLALACCLVLPLAAGVTVLSAARPRRELLPATPESQPD